MSALHLGPSEWTDGSDVTWEPWTDGHAVGFKVTCNGVMSYIYLNPSGGGDSPDTFLYQGAAGSPGEDTPLCYITPDGVKPGTE